jgi:acyl carrier protein
MAIDRERVVSELQDLLREVWRDHPGGDVDTSTALKDVGVQSSTMLTFLVRIEERFKFKWDPDLPAGALSRLDTIAGAVGERAPAA